MGTRSSSCIEEHNVVWDRDVVVDMVVEEKGGDMAVDMFAEEKVGDTFVDIAVEKEVDIVVVGIVAAANAGNAAEEVIVVRDDKASRAFHGFLGGNLDVDIVPLQDLSSAEEAWGMDGMFGEEATAGRCDGRVSRAAQMFRGGIRTCCLHEDIAPPNSVEAGFVDRADIAGAPHSLD